MPFQNMRAQLRAYREGVVHATFNPEGPGAVRIHLIPPKFRLFRSPRYLVLLNGYYLLPIGYSWAVLLSEFLKQLNCYDGAPINEDAAESVLSFAVSQTNKVFPNEDAALLRQDLEYILDILVKVARNEAADFEIESLSIRRYAKNMSAPHRMDLLISSMTDGDGNWHCNQNCRFCYAAEGERAKELELATEDWKKIIGECRNAGIPMLTFTGGEPTLRRDLPELVAYAKWFVTRLNTNGILLTKQLAQELRRSSLDSVQITLYSADPAVHNALVGGGHFAKTVRGLENALEAGLDVSVNTPLCKLNADYLSTLRFLREKGVRYATCSGLICTGNAEANHSENDLSQEELFGILTQASEFCAETGTELSFTSPGLVSGELLKSIGIRAPMCGACLSNMAVSPSGEALPCQSWLGTESLGNVLQTPWKRIWNNSKCKAIRGMSESEAEGCPFRKSEGKDV